MNFEIGARAEIGDQCDTPDACAVTGNEAGIVSEGAHTRIAWKCPRLDHYTGDLWMVSEILVGRSRQRAHVLPSDRAIWSHREHVTIELDLQHRTVPSPSGWNIQRPPAAVLRQGLRSDPALNGALLGFLLFCLFLVDNAGLLALSALSFCNLRMGLLVRLWNHILGLHLVVGHNSPPVSGVNVAIAGRFLLGAGARPVAPMGDGRHGGRSNCRELTHLVVS